MREIVLDTETTGFSPKSGHKIVEIGCVELINQIATGETYHQYVNPERDVPEDAFAVHGLSEEFLSDKPNFAAVADGFMDFIGDARLVIHNAEFDLGFLNWELGSLGRESLETGRVTDTVRLARRKFPGAPASLDALCRRFDIDNSNRQLHGALLDARLLADVYLELTGGRQRGLSLSGPDTGGEEIAAAAGAVRKPRPHAPSPEELAAHEAFVGGLTGALWTR